MPVSLSVGVLQQFSPMLFGYIGRQRQVLMAHGVWVPEEKRGGKKKTVLIQFQFLLVMVSIITLKIPYRVIVAESHILVPTFIQAHSLPLGKVHQLPTSSPVI